MAGGETEYAAMMSVGYKQRLSGMSHCIPWEMVVGV